MKALPKVEVASVKFDPDYTGIVIKLKVTPLEPGNLYVDPNPNGVPVAVFEVEAGDEPDNVVARFYSWEAPLELRSMIALTHAQEYVEWYNHDYGLDEPDGDALMGF